MSQQRNNFTDFHFFQWKFHFRTSQSESDLKLESNSSEGDGRIRKLEQEFIVFNQRERLNSSVFLKLLADDLA